MVFPVSRRIQYKSLLNIRSITIDHTIIVTPNIKTILDTHTLEVYQKQLLVMLSNDSFISNTYDH